MPKQPRDTRRARRTPPLVGISHLRRALGLTLDQVIIGIADEVGVTYTRGALSAVENGHRGPSADMLRGMSAVYGLDVSEFVLSPAVAA